jgi:hypothetical protein
MATTHASDEFWKQRVVKEEKLVGFHSQMVPEDGDARAPSSMSQATVSSKASGRASKQSGAASSQWTATTRSVTSTRVHSLENKLQEEKAARAKMEVELAELKKLLELAGGQVDA